MKNFLLFIPILLLTALAPITWAETVEKKANFSQAITTNSGLFKLNVSAKALNKIPVNQFHQWVLTIKDANGQAVNNARIAISGGMPAHGHGLPTQPRVEKRIGDGQYLISGMKFNMDGQWKLRFLIVQPTQKDMAELDVNVSY